MTAPVPPRAIFTGKLFTVGKLILFTHTVMGILFIICGKIAGLSGWPSLTIIRGLLMGCLAGFAMAALQLLLSMRIRSFAIPIGISLIGGVLGLVLTSMNLGMFWPYSLLALGMNANGRDVLGTTDTIIFIITCFCFTLLFTGIATRQLSKKDT